MTGILLYTIISLSWCIWQILTNLLRIFMRDSLISLKLNTYIIIPYDTMLWYRLEQCQPWSWRHPDTARLACLLNQTHLIQVISSLVETTMQTVQCCGASRTRVGNHWSRTAVFNSSPRAPPLCTFCMFLSSLQTFVLFDRKCPAKWTSRDIPPSFQFEASVYVPFKGH